MKLARSDDQVSVSEEGKYPRSLVAFETGGGEVTVAILNSGDTVMGMIDLPWRELVLWAERVTEMTRGRYHG